MLHALLLTCILCWIRNTSACCHKLDTESVLTLILDCWLTHFPHHPAINLFKQRKHPNSSSEVSVESRAFCASVCWWMMPKRRAGRQGLSFFALWVCVVSVVNITRAPDPDAVPGDEWGKSYPASCVAGRSQGSLCRLCGSSVGPIVVSKDAHFNDGVCSVVFLIFALTITLSNCFGREKNWSDHLWKKTHWNMGFLVRDSSFFNHRQL